MPSRPTRTTRPRRVAASRVSYTERWWSETFVATLMLQVLDFIREHVVAVNCSEDVFKCIRRYTRKFLFEELRPNDDLSWMTDPDMNDNVRVELKNRREMFLTAGGETIPFQEWLEKRLSKSCVKFWPTGFHGRKKEVFAAVASLINDLWQGTYTHHHKPDPKGAVFDLEKRSEKEDKDQNMRDVEEGCVSDYSDVEESEDETEETSSEESSEGSSEGSSDSDDDVSLAVLFNTKQ